MGTRFTLLIFATLFLHSFNPLCTILMSLILCSGRVLCSVDHMILISCLIQERNGSLTGFWHCRPEKILPRGINRLRNSPKFTMPGCFRSKNIPATEICTPLDSIRSWFGQLIKLVYWSQFGKPWVWRTCRLIVITRKHPYVPDSVSLIAHADI
jgi:hypothetical protein